MTILLNGSPRLLETSRTLAQLLDELGVRAAKKAVERNGEIIPSSAFSTTPLGDGDRIEIIQFVGGG